jgi:hypothetical protein
LVDSYNSKESGIKNFLLVVITRALGVATHD